MEFVITVDDDFTFDVYEEEEEEAQKSSDQDCSSLDFRIKEEIDDFDFEDNYYFDQKFTKLIDVKTELEPNEEKEGEDEEEREVEVLRFDNETSLDSLPNLNEDNEEMMNIVNSLMNEESSSSPSQNDSLITTGEVFQTIDSSFSNLNIADFDTPLFEELDLTADDALTSERNDSFADNLELPDNSVANLFKIVDVRSCAVEETRQNDISTNGSEENGTVESFDTSTGVKKRRVDKENENEISSPLIEENKFNTEDVLKSSESSLLGDENVDSSTNCGLKKRKIEDAVEDQRSISSLVVEENVLDNNVKSLEVPVVNSVNDIEETCIDDKIEENGSSDNISLLSEDENISDLCVEDVEMLENFIVNFNDCQDQEDKLESSVLHTEGIESSCGMKKRINEDGSETQNEISSLINEENVFDSTVKSLESVNDVNNTEETRLKNGSSDKIEKIIEDISSLLQEEGSSSAVENESVDSSCCKTKKRKIESGNENHGENSSIIDENVFDSTVKSPETVNDVSNAEETLLNGSLSDKIEECDKNISSVLGKESVSITHVESVQENLILNLNDCLSQEDILHSSVVDSESIESMCCGMKKRKIEDRIDNQDEISSSIIKENVFDNTVKLLETVNITEETPLNNNLSDTIEENDEDNFLVLEKENDLDKCPEGNMSESLVVSVNNCQSREDIYKSSLFDDKKIDSSCSEEKKRNIEDTNENQSEMSSLIIEENMLDKTLSDKIDENENNVVISSPLENASKTYEESGQMFENLIDSVNDCEMLRESLLLVNESVESPCSQVKKRKIEDTNERPSQMSSSVIEENVLVNNLSDKIDANENNVDLSSPLENACNTCEESGQVSENLFDNVNDCEIRPEYSLFVKESVESSCCGEMEDGNENQNRIMEENNIDNSVKSPEDSNVIDGKNVEEMHQDNGLTNNDKQNKSNKNISSLLKEQIINGAPTESVELSENLTDDDNCLNQFNSENVEVSNYEEKEQVESPNTNQNENSSFVSEDGDIFDSNVKSSEMSDRVKANVKYSKPTKNLSDNGNILSNAIFDSKTIYLSNKQKYDTSSSTVSIKDDKSIVTSIRKEQTTVADDNCQAGDKSIIVENKEIVPDSTVNKKIEIKADVQKDFDTSIKSSVRATGLTKKVPTNVVKSVISDCPNEVSNFDKPQTSKICQNVKPKPTPNNTSSSPNKFNNGSNFKPSRNSSKFRNNMKTRAGHPYVNVGNTDRSGTRIRQFPRSSFNRNPNVNIFQNNNVFSLNNSFNNCQNLQNWQCYNIVLDALKQLIFQRNYQNMVNSAHNVSAQLFNQYCQQQQQNLLDFQRQQRRVQLNGNQRLVFDSVSFNFRRQNVRENNFRINPTVPKTFHKKSL